MLTLIWCRLLRITTALASRSKVSFFKRPSESVWESTLSLNSSAVSLVAVVAMLSKNLLRQHKTIVDKVPNQCLVNQAGQDGPEGEVVGGGSGRVRDGAQRKARTGTMGPRMPVCLEQFQQGQVLLQALL